MLTGSDEVSDKAAALPSQGLEFRFRWDKREHRRFYRTLQREARRGSKVRWVLNVWFGLIALVGIRALWPDSDGADFGVGVLPLAIVGGWFVFDRWGLAYLSAQSYERAHAACIPNDQIRVLDADGITAKLYDQQFLGALGRHQHGQRNRRVLSVLHSARLRNTIAETRRRRP